MIILLSTLALVACSDPPEDSQPTESPASPASCVLCTGIEEDIAVLEERVGALEDQLDTVQSGLNETNARLAALEDTEPPQAVVLSSYRVDCNRQTFMYEEFYVEYDARYAAGTLYGLEGIYSHCPLVMGVEAGNMPHVTVAQVHEVEPDTVCEASYCPNTSANGWWYNNNSGGHVVAGGYDDMRMAPGMQLRFDEVRQVIYTASDYRRIWSGSGEGPLFYEVTVIGDRAYTAPEGWL